jgi:hypothetical protein
MAQVVTVVFKKSRNNFSQQDAEEQPLRHFHEQATCTAMAHEATTSITSSHAKASWQLRSSGHIITERKHGDEDDTSSQKNPGIIFIFEGITAGPRPSSSRASPEHKIPQRRGNLN